VSRLRDRPRAQHPDPEQPLFLAHAIRILPTRYLRHDKGGHRVRVTAPPVRF
jgi:hypothetical protein